MKGWVYVITNKSMPGIVKVGYTMRDTKERADELGGTGSPHAYDVEYEVLVEEPREIEQAVHSRLKNLREGKEWFRCTSYEAILSIRDVIGTKEQVENFILADRLKADAERHQRDRTEEERQKLDSERQLIISRYELILKTALPNRSYWIYYTIVFIALTIVIALLAPEMKGNAALLLLLLGSFTITPIVQSHYEDKAKDSAQYNSILSERDAELEKIDSKKEGRIQIRSATVTGNKG